jgi:hypothetical protein
MSDIRDISDSENEVDVVEETLNVGCVTNKERPQRVIKKTRKICGMKILITLMSRQVR